MGSKVMATILRSDLSADLDPAHATITGSKYLASYSWVKSDMPTILVPGTPSLWSPPTEPLQLQPDSGQVYINENAARMPDAPLMPLFEALFAQKPEFDVSNIDVVTDRNNIRKLLRFVGGTSNEAFQMQVEIVNGKLALFTRMEDENTHIIRGFRGYDRNFEKAYTKRVAGTSSYSRITSFRFGGLEFLVRQETDGYVDVAAPKQAGTADSLQEFLEILQLFDTVPAPSFLPGVAVKRQGKEVDCSAMLEIKTRAAGETLDMHDTTAQLWISQIPYLAVGYYNNGVFDNVQVQYMTQTVRDWEKSNEKMLCSLGDLLHRIIEVVKGSADQTAIVKYSGGVELEVMTVEPEKDVPEEVDPNWLGGKQGTGNAKPMERNGNGLNKPF